MTLIVENKKALNLARRAEGAVQFWHRVDEEGGVLTLDLAAKILGISILEANDYVSKGQIFTIDWEGERRIPGFQFKENGFIEHFHYLLALMQEKSFSDIFITSIFINTVTYTNRNDPVYRQLQHPIQKHQLLEIQRCVLGAYGQ